MSRIGAVNTRSSCDNSRVRYFSNAPFGFKTYRFGRRSCGLVRVFFGRNRRLWVVSYGTRLTTLKRNGPRNFTRKPKANAVFNSNIRLVVSGSSKYSIYHSVSHLTCRATQYFICRKNMSISINQN